MGLTKDWTLQKKRLANLKAEQWNRKWSTEGKRTLRNGKSVSSYQTLSSQLDFLRREGTENFLKKNSWDLSKLNENYKLQIQVQQTPSIRNMKKSTWRKAHQSQIAQINMVSIIKGFRYISAKLESEDPSKMPVRTAEEAVGRSERDDSIHGDAPARPPPRSSGGKCHTIPCGQPGPWRGQGPHHYCHHTTVWHVPYPRFQPCAPGVLCHESHLSVLCTV